MTIEYNIIKQAKITKNTSTK